MSDLARQFIDRFIAEDGSDLYLIAGGKPHMHASSEFPTLREEPLTKEEVLGAMKSLIGAEGMETFESTLEYNTAIEWAGGEARLRLNMFMQRQLPGIVIRKITTKIPTLEDLKMPQPYADIIMEKRGLVLVVGPTGSGKSTSLAAMIGHRNRNGHGHIVTIEDPVEFVHQHAQCIISQRDVGVDTLSFDIALKNTLRQAPDVIMIGEVRDAKTMESAISFAETGHLVLATLHANNSNQAIERVLNFFPQEKHHQVLLNLSMNLRGIMSQRLINTGKGKRLLAVEIMLNQGLIRDLIAEGKIREIKECIEKSRDQGMISFDQSLFDMYKAGLIDEDKAMAESDNPANLRVQFRQVEMQKKMSALQGAGNQQL
jgi:twitching motility protein PilU